MPGVAGGFLEQVRDDPAQRDMAAVIGDHAQFVEGRGGGDHRVNSYPSASVGGQRGVHGLVCCYRRRLLTAGEPMHDLQPLGVGQVFDKPEQRGAAGHRRLACGNLRDSKDLAGK